MMLFPKLVAVESTGYPKTSEASWGMIPLRMAAKISLQKVLLLLLCIQHCPGRRSWPCILGAMWAHKMLVEGHICPCAAASRSFAGPYCDHRITDSVRLGKASEMIKSSL